MFTYVKKKLKLFPSFLRLILSFGDSNVKNRALILRKRFFKIVTLFLRLESHKSNVSSKKLGPKVASFYNFDILPLSEVIWQKPAKSVLLRVNLELPLKKMSTKKKSVVTG